MINTKVKITFWKEESDAQMTSKALVLFFLK